MITLGLVPIGRDISTPVPVLACMPGGSHCDCRGLRSTPDHYTRNYSLSDVERDLVGGGGRLNDCSMKHYIVLNMALFSHAHVTISAEIKLTHACSRGDVSHERTAAA